MARRKEMRPLAWHQECLENATRNVEREEVALLEQQKRVARNRQSVDAARRDIEYAISCGETELPIS